MEFSLLCKSPITLKKTQAVRPCSQCLSCRINRRRIWAHRLMLEGLQHDTSVFLTLTYSDVHLPSEYVDPDTGEFFYGPTLSPGDHRQFMDLLRTRFRRSNRGAQLRFYAVGEYGDKTQRPHYHYALFGYPRCDRRGSYWIGKKFVPCPCSSCQFISEIWGKGHVFVGDLTTESSNYIAQYVTKKMTKKDDPRLNGRYPEFCRMSRNPGIAGDVVDIISSRLTSFGKTAKDDVPNVLMHGTKQLPLGRYLTDRLHDNLSHLFEPREKLSAYETSLRSMLLFNPDASPEVARAYSSGSVAVALQLLNSQRVLNLETQYRIFGKEKLL